MRMPFVLIAIFVGLLVLAGCSDDPEVIISDDPCDNKNLSLTFAHQAIAGGYELSVTINGSVGPYNYIWSTGDWFLDEPNAFSTTTINNPNTRTYVTVYDTDSCTVMGDHLICENSTLSANISVMDDDMAVIVSGGDTPYTYLWNDGNTDPDRLDLLPGTYCVTVTDHNGMGCFVDDCSSVLDTIFGSFTDPRDGTTYLTIDMSGQIWMAENLNYNTANSWCYDDETFNCGIYGRLYNWEVAINSCPAGWHLPTETEWTAFTDYLGGSEFGAGGKMKATGTTLWNSPNTGATNSSGFTALPGGGKDADGTFIQLHDGGFFWTSTEMGNTFAWYRGLGFDSPNVTRDNSIKTIGMSVRCVKD